MSPFDVYCAICGGPFHIETEQLLSSTIPSITKHHLAWLKSVRLVGRNLSTNKAYLSGPGVAERYGSARVEVGEDVNVPASSGSGRGDGTMSVSCYSVLSAMGGTDKLSPLPVHCKCWEVMQQAHEHRGRRSPQRSKVGVAPKTVDLDVMRGVMEDLLKGGTNCLNGMDYLELRPEPYGDVWNDDDCIKARLAYLLDPMITGDRKLGKVDLPHSNDAAPTVDDVAKRPEVTVDPFGHLPTEILLQLVDDLPTDSLYSLLEVSSSVARRCDDDAFWLRRIKTDMRYAEELLPDVESLLQDCAHIDWQQLHIRLWRASHVNLGQGLATDASMLGLASRRRVWRCVEQILDLYDEQAGLPSMCSGDSDGRELCLTELLLCRLS